jgi:H+/Cl- antiporter ClcA
VILSLLAAVLGFAGGVVGFVFLKLTALLLSLCLQHRVAWTFPSLTHLRAGWWLVPEAAVGGAAVAGLASYEPLIRGHGIPEAMEAVLARQSRISVRTAWTKPIASVIAIGTGSPFGAEGPIILTGGALGSLLGQAVKVSPAERRVLLAAGAAAGMSAIFGAPIGAVLLAIELLLFEFSPRVFVPIVVASVIADGVHIVALGAGPLFAVPHQNFAGLERLPLYAILGIACGLVAVLVTWGAFAAEDAFQRLPVRRFWQPVFGAVVVAVIDVLIPRAAGVGYNVIGDTLAGRLTVGLLAALFIAKLGAWCIALGSGTSGSSLAPLLLIGASLGGVVAAALHALVPGLPVSPVDFSIVAMAALFGAAAGAPFTAIVLVFEITRDYNVILPLMLATVVADLLARFVQSDTLMTRKLARHGILVTQRYEIDLQRTTTVAAVMAAPAEVIDVSATVGTLKERFRATDRHAFAVTENGKLVGIVTQGDLLRHPTVDLTPIGEVAATDVAWVSPESTVFEATRRLMHEHVRQLPVVDGGQLVGMFGRLDALRVSEMGQSREASQPGWFTRGRRAR